jgi:hypothetical protein
MPCYEKVMVSIDADITVNDVESLKKTVSDLGGRMTSQTTFTLNGVEFSGVVHGGKLTARAERGVDVGRVTDVLRKKYVTNATTAWAKKYGFSVKVNQDETKIQMRKWK